jgi:hypothetical protein
VGFIRKEFVPHRDEGDVEQLTGQRSVSLYDKRGVKCGEQFVRLYDEISLREGIHNAIEDTSAI